MILEGTTRPSSFLFFCAAALKIRLAEKPSGNFSLKFNYKTAGGLMTTTPSTNFPVDDAGTKWYHWAVTYDGTIFKTISGSSTSWEDK